MRSIKGFQFPTSSKFFRQIAFFGGMILLWPGMIIAQQERPSAKELSIEKRLIDGKKYILLADWEKAEAMFRAILDEDVQNAAACYELSRTLAATGRHDEALTFIRKAARIEPDNEWYLLMEADIHERRGDIHATMEMYEKLMQLKPDKSHYYEVQIDFGKRIGDHERVLRVLDVYEANFGISPSSARTRFEVLDGLGRSQEALSTLTRLAALFPFNLDYKFLAASYARQSGQEETAQKLYREILDVEPENSRAKLALAGTEKSTGDDATYLNSVLPVMSNPALEPGLKFEELVPYMMRYAENRDAALGDALLKVCRELVRVHPQDARSHAILGDVLSIRGEYAEAISSYETSTSIRGNVYAVWEQLLHLLIAERDYDALLQQAKQAQDYFPNQAFLFYAAGYAECGKRNFDAALEWLNEALVMTGRNTGQKISILNRIGLVYDALGDLEKSSYAFETALALDPKRAETLVCYSLSLSRRISQSEKAMSMTERVLQLSDVPEELQETLAETLYFQRKYPQALESIQMVLKAHPNRDAFNLAGDILLKLEKVGEAVDMWEKAIAFGGNEQEIRSKITSATRNP